MSEKQDLIKEAEKLGLDTEGTSAELKARIKSAHEAEPVGEGVENDPEAPAGTEPETEEQGGEPEVVEEKAPGSLPSIGAFVSTENFNLNISEHGGGAPLLNVARKGWVGPAQLTVHRDLLLELIEGLTELSQQD